MSLESSGEDAFLQQPHRPAHRRLYLLDWTWTKTTTAASQRWRARLYLGPLEVEPAGAFLDWIMDGWVSGFGMEERFWLASREAAVWVDRTEPPPPASCVGCVF